MTAGIIIRNFDGTDDTLIAVDHRWTAEDRSSDHPGTKIFRGPTLCAVAAGDLSQVQRLFSRLDQDRPLDESWFAAAFAEEEFDDVSALVVFRDGGRAFTVSGNGGALAVDVDSMDTIGGGGDVLAGAFMHDDERDPRSDAQRLEFAFRAAAHWRDDVSAEYDWERVGQ